MSRACFYCEEDLGSHGVLDHMTPTSRGGSNVPENLADCCFSCNSRKSNRTVEEYREYLSQKRGAPVVFPGERTRPGPYGVPLEVPPRQKFGYAREYTLRCRLSPEERDRAFSAAKRNGMSVSAYLRFQIETNLDQVVADLRAKQKPSLLAKLERAGIVLRLRTQDVGGR